MRRKLWILVCCAVLCLTGCSKQEQTYAEKCWESVSVRMDMDEYINQNMAGWNVETLQQEANDAESPLRCRFKAVALLCASEYGNQQEQYPMSSAYAKAILGNLLTDEENFWKEMKEVYCFDAFIPLLLDAAGEFDGEILVKLLEVPKESGLQYSVQNTVKKWIEGKPEKMPMFGESLMASGYFDDWNSPQWKDMFFSEGIHMDSIDDAVKHIAYLRDTILPLAQDGRNPALYVGPSKATGEDYLYTTLTIGIGEELTLQEPGTDLPEEIVTEGKKLIALYRNLQGDEFPSSPEPMRLLGDFMLNLSAQEYPASIEEADYYLVLTSAYEYGDYYYYENGEPSDIMEVYSTTSVDLYEAGTGRFLRHLGNLIENPARGIVDNGSGNKLRYPEEVTADILYYIYSHVNEPEAYAMLVDQIGDQIAFDRDEAVLLGKWEIVYHSSEIVDTFEDLVSTYVANEGNRFIKAECTITNRGNVADTLFSIGSDSWNNVNICLIDSESDAYYDNLNQDTMDSRILGKGRLEPGESQMGAVFFEVPDKVAQKKDTLCITLVYPEGRKVLLCPLE